MSANIHGKQIKQNSIPIDRINPSTGQYLLFDTGTMLGLTDAPTIDTDLANKKYVDDSITNAIGSNITNNVIVNATNTDTYIGIGIPTILSYNINTLYIVTFANSNTITNPTLDIDGIGPIVIVKTDTSGIIPLTIGDIVPSIQYFLTYNGIEFQLYTSNPTGSVGTYTNLNPVPVTLGGVNAGTIFNSNSITSVFDMLLYPYQSANFTSFTMSSQSTLIEVGDNVIGGNRTFNWSTSNNAYITPNTIEISKVTGGLTTLVSGLANTGSGVVNIGTTISYITPNSYTWQIKAIRTNSTIFVSNYTITWAYKFYYGTSINTSLTSSDILSLSGNILRTSTVNGTYALTTGGYKYFCIPSNLPSPTSFKDASTNLTVGMADSSDGFTGTDINPYNFQLINVTNINSVVHSYKVYRTKYILGGSINIIIS